MRLDRGDRIAGLDGLQLRNYLRRFGSAYVEQTVSRRLGEFRYLA